MCCCSMTIVTLGGRSARRVVTGRPATGTSSAAFARFGGQTPGYQQKGRSLTTHVGRSQAMKARWSEQTGRRWIWIAVLVVAATVILLVALSSGGGGDGGVPGY